MCNEGVMTISREFCTLDTTKITRVSLSQSSAYAGWRPRQRGYVMAVERHVAASVHVRWRQWGIPGTGFVCGDAEWVTERGMWNSTRARTLARARRGLGVICGVEVSAYYATMAAVANPEIASRRRRLTNGQTWLHYDKCRKETPAAGCAVRVSIITLCDV